MADQLQTHQVLPSASQPGGYARETMDAVNTVVSISSLMLRCFGDFQSLIDALSTQEKQSPARSRVREELGRLRVWAGNSGAHRKQTDRLSLDHRLREAPDLHRTVRNHLVDISETIKEASACLLTSPESANDANLVDGEDSGSESSDSDGFWEQMKTEASHRSPIDVYTEDLSHAVTSLYKLSLSLQNPAHRDRSVQASRIDLHHFEFYDIHHVCDKFNLAPDSILAQRLGRANTKRRQLLAYYKDHRDKISKYVDVAMSKAVPVPVPQLSVNIELQSEHQRRPPTISTQWTQDTTVSTIYQDNDVASDSGRTRFSATTSTAGDQVQNSIPPPPRGSNVTRRHPFICPYCHQTVQVENDEDWIYHVYSDLRPYICTFGGCVKENQLYDSFTEWSAHERQFHRREWFCTLCPYNSADTFALLSHLDDDHTDIPEEQRKEMANQSKPSSLAQQCPLCTKPPINNSSRFQQHLARHLQQLALFVLPRSETDDEESASREEESDESRQALVMDLEDRESLGSISAASKASAESSISGLHSPTDDRLLDGIPVDTVNETSDGIAGESKDTEATDFRGNHRNDPLKTEADAIAALESTRTSLGPEHPDTISCMDDLTEIYVEQGQLQDLEPFLEELLDIKRRILGFEHASTMKSMRIKGWMLFEQSRLDEAEEVQEWTLKARETILGTDNPFTLETMYDLVQTYFGRQKFDQAEDLGLRLIKTAKEVLGENHAHTLWALHAQSRISLRKGDYEEGESFLWQILDVSEKQTHDEEQWMVGKWATIDIVKAFFAKGDLESAEKYLRRMLESMKATTNHDRSRIEIAGAIADVCFAESRLDDAESLYKDGMETAARVFGTTMTGYRPNFGASLARVYHRQKRFDEARELMAESAQDLLNFLVHRVH